MDGILYAVAALAGWLGLGYAIHLSWGRWTWTRVGTSTAFGSFALGMTLSVPAIGAAIDRATGLHELWRVLAHLCVMGIVASAEAQLLALAYPPGDARRRLRGRIALSAAAAAVLVVCYMLASRHPEPVTFNVESARIPAVSVYLLVYLAAFVWYTVDIARLARRFARITPRPWSRRGLRIASWGAVLGLLYCFNKAAFIVGYLLGYQPAGEKRITALLLTVSGLLCVGGFTMPAWGPAIDAANRWRSHRRDYRLLYPLWRDLVRANPELVLDTELDSDRAPLRGLDYALTRRVVEICDARLALRPYIDSRAPDRTGQNGRHDDEAESEAARISAGLVARADNRSADDPDETPIVDPPGGYDGQVAWLVAVARAYANLHADEPPRRVITGASPRGKPAEP